MPRCRSSAPPKTPGKSCACEGASRLQLRFDDRHTSVLLVGPLAVVVLPRALRLALEAPHVLLLHDAAVVVEGDAGVLLGAGVVLHGGAALLVFHDGWVGAAGAGVLLRGHGHRGEADSEAHRRPHLVAGRGTEPK